VEKTAYEKLHDLYCSSNIIRVIKSRRIRWVQHVACMVDKRKYTSFHGEKLRDRDHLEHTNVDNG